MPIPRLNTDHLNATLAAIARYLEEQRKLLMAGAKLPQSNNKKP